MAVRVRFAPSPTGYFHVGGTRTALYNWVFARQQGGTFILRIEDTDEERNKEEWVGGIYDAMRWVGLDWDELYRQSERKALYEAAARQLEASGHAYWCDCTREAVDARSKERGGPPGYDGHCRDRGLESGEGRALRFRTPDDGATVVHDLIRGDVEFANSTIDDPVIVRSSGVPIFVLANVVDDADMRITHVIRSEEHLPTTPKHILLWKALGHGEPPVYAHPPVVVNEKRQKLSKRRDPVALEMYRDEGYLPEVMLNYLALIGWSPPDHRERFTVSEMVEDFSLEGVGKSPGFFDVKKLRAFNADSIRAMSVDDFIAAVEPFAARLSWADRFDLDRFRAIAPLVQERVEVLSEAAPMVDFLFLDEPAVDEASWSKTMTADAGPVLDAAATAWESIPWTPAAIGEATLAIADQLEVSRKKAQAPVRVAITGRTVGPPLWESLEILGRDRALERLRAARAKLVSRRGFGRVRRLVYVAVALVVIYFGVTFVQVWRASHTDGPVAADAIVVLGAAQYDGQPSPVLRSRLDHAIELYDDGVTPIIVVTGGNQPGDRFTEASAGDRYLQQHGIPAAALRLEVQGSSSWESLAAAARFLREEGITDVVLVSSPYHALRTEQIAGEVGLHGMASPADETAGIGSRAYHLTRETLAVGIGRVLGHRRLVDLEVKASR